MTTYNTGNPIGSKDPKDLYDNAENLDTAVNDTSRDTWHDRLGRNRKTMSGMEREFNADQASRDDRFNADQDDRDARFNTFIASSGYQFLGDYAAGIEITEYNQIIRDADGEFWRLSGQVELPYTTTGDWSTEGDLFVSVGDAVLRQDLVQPVATFNNVADMVASVGLGVGRKVRTLGYYTPGDGGGCDYEIVAAGSGTDDGGSFIDLAGSGLQAKGLFNTTASPAQFGAQPNEGADNSMAIKSCLIYCSKNDITVIGNGSMYECKSTINITLNNGIYLTYLNLKYTGAGDQHVFFRFRTEKDCFIENCFFDADKKASKVFHISPNSPSVSIFVGSCTFLNGLQTNTATSTASGIQVNPDNTLDYFSKLTIDNCIFSDITSIRDNPEELSVVSVGRGVSASDCESMVISNCKFNEIGPYWDGDGIAVWATREVPERRENFSLQVSNCHFTNCHKRSIKSQVGQTVVDNIVSRRTQPFIFRAGQSEIDLLEGGRISNVYCYYAAGSAPRHIFSVASSQKVKNTAPSFSVSGLTVDFENPDDVLESIGRFTLEHQGKVENVTMSDVSVGCYVHNLVSLRTADQVTENDGIFENVVLDGVYVRGFDITQPDAALAVVTRGSVSYCQPKVSFYNCRSADGTIPQLFYLDPGPGTTNYLRPRLKDRFNSPARDAVGTLVLDMHTPIRSYRYGVREDGSKIVEFDMPDRGSGSCKVSVFYTSTRDERGAKLFTEGVIQVGGNRSFYLETVAGNTVSAQAGEIRIQENTNFRRFSVQKDPGGSSNFGELIITVQDLGYISEVFD